MRGGICHQPKINLRRVLGYRQEQVHRFVMAYFAECGIAPSYTIISSELGIEKSNVCRIVCTLERHGLVSRAGAGRVRRIRLS